jgi:hypothetical protein
MFGQMGRCEWCLSGPIRWGLPRRAQDDGGLAVVRILFPLKIINYSWDFVILLHFDRS